MLDEVPNFQKFMRPTLEAVRNGEVYYGQDITDKTAEILGLSESAKNIMIKSGKIPAYKSRAVWARLYLTQAEALEKTARGYFKITDRGKELLARNEDINIDTLRQYPEFLAFEVRKGTRSSNNNGLEKIADASIEELIDNAEKSNEAEVKSELLNKLKKVDPYYFEKICVDVLTAMNYGGGKDEFANVTKKSNDGGIDGIIKQDPLGLNNVYIQAKRWENDIQEKQIRDFIGALVHKNAEQGVFITTSSFAEKAKDAARNHKVKIALIDGEQLVVLMLKYKIGIEIKRTVEMFRVDEDYFSEE
jgi:restriction system protein